MEDIESPTVPDYGAAATAQRKSTMTEYRHPNYLGGSPTVL